MALLDIVVEGYQVEQEENRGDIGTITDMVVGYENESIIEVPLVVGSGSWEYIFGYVN